jgi:hypothetical protein
MPNSRVPETIPAFNIYMNTTDAYLQQIDAGSGLPNWQRLGLALANNTDWHNNLLFWRDTLYKKYLDPTLSTSSVKAEVRQFMKDFRKFASPLLVLMAASANATTADELEFRFKRHRRKRTFHTTPISDLCSGNLVHLGGGEFKIICRSTDAEGRPRKADKADSIQIAYSIGNTTPPNPEQGMTKEIFTKCVFVLDAGYAHIGKKIYVYFRWYNTKHPLLAGPWGNLVETVVA